MSVEGELGHLFKSEVRSAGEELVGAVVLKQTTDRQIEAVVKGGTTLSKVSFWSESIEAESFFVDCSCTYSQKDRLCRHAWAVLLVASKKFPDFFENKRTLEKASRSVDDKAAGTTAKAEKQKYVSPKAEEYKRKQADYRKLAYQAQKERAKTQKRETKSRASKQPVSEKVAAALKYFEANGFPMSLPVDEEAVQSAKRILSRVFHPDKGGTNDEIIELLRHSKTLLES